MRWVKSGAIALPLVLLASLALARPQARALPDADGDGLPDAWERDGVTIRGQFIDLPAMGADPARPDIFLQIDWMADETHDQRPDPAALQRVVEAFAAAPYTSPTGSVGITLHVDAGPEGAMNAAGAPWGALSRARALPWQDTLGSLATGTYDWTAFQAIRDMPGGFTDSGRAPVFHYAIFGHYHDRDDPAGSGASGISRGIGGTDILITLGNFTDGTGTAQEQAGTLMHELGHNLGLRHGGDDDTNFKPGYVSVMNYAFQMDGIVRGGVRGVLDYSRGVEPVLDERLADDPPALLATAAPAGAACVPPTAVRSGMAVRPLATDPTCGACADATDDWENIRLRVGTIGQLH